MDPNQRLIGLRHPGRLYIDGEWLVPNCPAPIEVRDPATEQIVATVAMGNAEDVGEAVSAARRAFDVGEWRRLTAPKRARYMRAIAEAILRRADDFARSWTLESGILYATSSALIGRIMSGRFLTYADMVESFPFEEPRKSSGGQQAWLTREPIGVVAAIVPWNSPAALTSYKVAPALAAGCTVVLKPPVEAPCSGFLLAEICEEVGLPRGVVNVVPAGRDASRTLVSDPRVDKVTFTGSTAVGRDIASTMGQRIGRYTLELGGKSPAIVLDDYDVESAANTLAAGLRMNAGQVCHSLSRVIVSRARHDEMVDALAEVCSGLTVGDPFDPATDVGPLSNARQRGSVERYIEIGRTEGAQLACGGGRPENLERGFFIEPTVFGNVDNRSTIGQEEIFGPVLSVIPVANEEEAVRTANETIFGLNASIFTHDPQRFRAIARRLESGTVGQNGSRTDIGIAFGGFKQSGVGREGGVEGLLSFLETKVVVSDAPFTST